MYICKTKIACVAHPAATSHTSESFTCAPRRVFPKGGGSQIPIQAATNNEQTPMRRMYAEIPGTDHSYVCFRIVLNTTSCMVCCDYAILPVQTHTKTTSCMANCDYATHLTDSKTTSCRVRRDYASLLGRHQLHFRHGTLRLRYPTRPTPRTLPAWCAAITVTYLTHNKNTSCMVCCDYAVLPDP